MNKDGYFVIGRLIFKLLAGNHLVTTTKVASTAAGASYRQVASARQTGGLAVWRKACIVG